MKTSPAEDPVQLFQSIYAEAVAKKIESADAMVLSTVSADGKPSARVVLLKGCDQNGFRFFTNYRSRKGKELGRTPFAAVTFFWPSLGRQIRIEGAVEALPDEASDSYWKGRPRESQLSAIVSAQSERIASFEHLAHQVASARAEYLGREIPRPRHWGGYRLLPETMEFWKLQENRLHLRTLYRATPGGWVMELLAP